MSAARTQADFQAFLVREAVRLNEETDHETELKIENSHRIISEDLSDAFDAVKVNHASSALNNLEEAMMICGEMIAWALGYKLKDAGGSFHARAIECLVTYTEVFEPALAIYARRFQSLRAARRAMKYEREAPGEGQLAQFMTAADAFYSKFKSIPDGVLSRRREYERRAR